MTVGAHFFIARIEIAIGTLTQGTGTPFVQCLIQPLSRPTNLGRRDLGAAKLFDDGTDLAGQDPLEIHLGEGEMERALTAQSLLEGAGIKISVPHLRDVELHFTDAGLDGLGLEAVGLATAFRRTLIRCGTEEFFTLGLNRGVENDANQFGEEVKTALGDFFQNFGR